MALIVQKFGGTSVGTIERIRHVARWALDSQARGDDIVLVVSAMSGETNRLVELATQLNPIPYSREYDMLIASGEQVAVGLVSLAINTEAEKRGLLKDGSYRSRPLLGHQIGILTDSIFSKARIQEINTTLLRREIAAGVIPVIAGFQGVDPDNNITTLGRGGSDTSAVAIAAALGADDCEIYTDVDGVYTTDPRMCADARKIARISYEEMMELASLGAKVLQIRSVEIAAKYKLPLHVRSSFNSVEGTRVVPQEMLGQAGVMEQVVVAGVAADVGQVKFTLQNLPERPGVAAAIFGPLSASAIVVDVIVQDVPSNGLLTISFTVGKGDHLKARQVLETLKTTFAQMKIVEEADLAKVSIVGVGMQNHPGVASKMFTLLAEKSISIKLITTSEIKVSCLIDAAQAKAAVECLHRGFELHRVE
ncbi:MAG: aspartate kinase [Oligoflexia bacterium]|nr:aspartate kinase [Oligoflexia bacterium]